MLHVESTPKNPEQSGQFVDDMVRLKVLEVELQRLSLREKELQLHNDLKTKKLELRMRELELGVASQAAKKATVFDISKNICLVSSFNEKEVDQYFILFERVASTLNRPKKLWTLLLQSVLTGKSQKVYSLLSADECQDFDKVKAAVLKAYELVPEAYRQKCCKLRKPENQTYIEFFREKETVFDRWCTATEAANVDQLKQLVLMEELKNCLPEMVSTYLSEHKTVDIFKAAVLVDEFVLTHRAVLGKPEVRGRKWTVEPDGKSERDHEKGTDEVMCYYCENTGHIVASCPVLKKRNTKPVALVNKLGQERDVPVGSGSSDLGSFGPFVMDGVVSLPGGRVKVPIKILRDTAASQSFILEEVLPFSHKFALVQTSLLKILA